MENEPSPGTAITRHRHHQASHPPFYAEEVEPLEVTAEEEAEVDTVVQVTIDVGNMEEVEPEIVEETPNSPVEEAEVAEVPVVPPIPEVVREAIGAPVAPVAAVIELDSVQRRLRPWEKKRLKILRKMPRL